LCRPLRICAVRSAAAGPGIPYIEGVNRPCHHTNPVMSVDVLAPGEENRFWTPVPPTAWVPPLVAAAGERAARTCAEFFVAPIANEHTRVAYRHVISRFYQWCET